MAAGLPDLVDCESLAAESATLARDYELRSLPRLMDLLAEPTGFLRASFDFSTLRSGAPGARVTFDATPRLECQRCLQPFDLHVSGASEVEFAISDEPAAAGSERECFRMEEGRVSLRDLAEEEVLLALPLAPACAAPRTCGRAPEERAGSAVRRPFSGLKRFVEENLIGHSTHGSSEKQKDPVQARHAPIAFGAGGARGIDRTEERRDAFAA